MKRSGEEFWALSYREIAACIDEYKNEREEINARHGIAPPKPRYRSATEVRDSFRMWHAAKGTN